MVEFNESKDITIDGEIDETRANRRRILKAGAVIAPFAVTLHGGIPMAHASSAGCVEELEKHVKIPHFKPEDEDDDDDDDNSNSNSNSNSHHEEYVRDGRMDSFDPERDSFTDRGNTGRLNDDGTPETHWDYLKNENEHGASCLQSFEDSGRIYHSDDSKYDHDDD